MNRLCKRTIYSSRIAAARRRTEFEPPQVKLPPIEPLTGNLGQDGLHRFEVDWLETAEWTKQLLQSMKKDAEMLQSKRQAFKLPQHPICIEETREFDYDFSKPVRKTLPVKAMFRVSDLGLTNEQAHKMRLLAGPLYNVATDVITLTETLVRPNDAKNSLSKAIEALITEVKEGKDDFTDIPLHIPKHRLPKRSLEVPSDWIQQSKELSKKIE